MAEHIAQTTAPPTALPEPPQTMRILTSWYLSRWTNAEATARMTGTSVDRIQYIGGYIGFALGELRLLCPSGTDL